jgi:hypothetical protein
MMCKKIPNDDCVQVISCIELRAQGDGLRDSFDDPRRLVWRSCCKLQTHRMLSSAMWLRFRDEGRAWLASILCLCQVDLEIASLTSVTPSSRITCKQGKEKVQVLSGRRVGGGGDESIVLVWLAASTMAVTPTASRTASPNHGCWMPGQRNFNTCCICIGIIHVWACFGRIRGKHLLTFWSTATFR